MRGLAEGDARQDPDQRSEARIARSTTDDRRLGNILRSCRVPAALTLLLGGLLFSAPALAAGSPENHFRLELGISYDSNPFLTPSAPYFDQNSENTLEPEAQPTFFLPLRVKGEHILPFPGGRNYVYSRYEVRANLYDKAFSRNADELFLRFAPGMRFGLGGPGGRERYLTVTPFVSHNKEIYFDRDTGLAVSTDGEDISSRYSYNALGTVAELQMEASNAFQLYIEGLYEKRNYESVPELESFNHDRVHVEGGMTVKLGRRARLTLDYGYRLQRYDERHARSLAGESDDINSLLEYGYTNLGAKMKLRPTSAWTVDIVWRRTDRDDRFSGYNDYAQDTYKLRTTVRTGPFEIGVHTKSWQRRFENAFIFDSPTDPRDGNANPSKSYDTIAAELYGKLRISQSWRFIMRVERTDQKTADPRLAYERDQLLLGLEWSP